MATFTLIKGKFKPLVGFPDGDSVRFLADDKTMFGKLSGKPAELGTGAESKDSVQLRFEGIDAIEKAATKPLSELARENMKALTGFIKDTNPEPAGYILSQRTDLHGRPISFAFAGAVPLADGASVELNAALLAKSVNYRQMRDGFAYPLYYNTLPAALRNKFNVAMKYAQTHNLGYWPSDKTNSGETVNGKDDLHVIAPVWPKLWRRLQEYLGNNPTLAGFDAFLAQKIERIILINVVDEVGLHDIVKVNGNVVSLTEPLKNLMVQTAI